MNAVLIIRHKQFHHGKDRLAHSKNRATTSHIVTLNLLSKGTQFSDDPATEYGPSRQNTGIAE